MDSRRRQRQISTRQGQRVGMVLHNRLVSAGDRPAHCSEGAAGLFYSELCERFGIRNVWNELQRNHLLDMT